MTFTTRVEIVKGRIDPAPMVDIVFLLLIFLMLSSPFVLQPGFGLVELPQVNNPDASSFQGLVVTVNRDNVYYFNNKRVTLEELRETLTTAVRRSPRQVLIIKADQQVSHGDIIRLMSLAFETGVPAINLATRASLSQPGPAR